MFNASNKCSDADIFFSPLNSAVKNLSHFLQVLMVTGGLDDSRLDSTEILRPGSVWQEITAKLPRPMFAVRMATVDNRVLLFGKWRKIKNAKSKTYYCCVVVSLTHTHLSHKSCYRGGFRVAYEQFRFQCRNLGIHQIQWIHRLEESGGIEDIQIISWNISRKF